MQRFTKSLLILRVLGVLCGSKEFPELADSHSGSPQRSLRASRKSEEGKPREQKHSGQNNCDVRQHSEKSVTLLSSICLSFSMRPSSSAADFRCAEGRVGRLPRWDKCVRPTCWRREDQHITLDGV